MFTEEDLKKRGLLYTSYVSHAKRKAAETEDNDMLSPSQIEFLSRRAGDGRYTPKTDTEIQLDYQKKKKAREILTTFQLPEVTLPTTTVSGVSKIESPFQSITQSQKRRNPRPSRPGLKSPVVFQTTTTRDKTDDQAATATVWDNSLSQQEYFRNRYNNGNRIREEQTPDYYDPKPVTPVKQPVVTTGFEVLSPGYVEYKSKDAAVTMVNTALGDLQRLSEQIASQYYTADGLRYRPPATSARFIQQLQTIRSALNNATDYLKQNGTVQDAAYTWANGVLNSAEQLLETVQTIHKTQSGYADEAEWNEAAAAREVRIKKETLDIDAETLRLDNMKGNLDVLKAGVEWVDRLWSSPISSPEEEQALYNRVDRWYTDICTMLRPYGYNITYDGTSEGLAKTNREIKQAIAELSLKLADEQEFVQSSKYLQLGTRLTEEALEAEDYTATTYRYDPTVRDPEYQFINTKDLSLDTAFTWLNINQRDALLQMTEKERRIYNYYYNTKGKQAADEYAYSLSLTLKERVAAERAAFFEDHPLLSVAYAKIAGLDQFVSGAKGLYHAVVGTDDYIVPSQTAVTGSYVRSNLDGAAGIAYDAVQSLSNMAPSVLASIGVTAATGSPGVGAFVGSTMMGLSAAGNAYVQAINEGKSDTQARVYSALVGASETVLQAALGGIGALGGNTLQSVVKVLDQVDNAFLRIGAHFGASALSEGTEEALQEVLTPFLENIAVGANRNTLKDINWEQAAYSFLLGAITGGVFEGGLNAVNDIQLQKVGKAILAEDGALQSLKDLAALMPEGSTTREVLANLGKSPTTYQVGKLLSSLHADMKTTAKAGKAASVLTVMEQQGETVSAGAVRAAQETVTPQTGSPETASPTVNSGIDPQRLSDAVNGKTRGQVIDARRSATPQTESTLSPAEIQGIQDAVAGKTRGRVIDVRGITPTTSTPTAIPSSSTLSDAESQRITDAVNGKTRGIIDARRSATAASQAQTASTDSVAELLARSRAGLRGERYVPSDMTSAIVDGENTSCLDQELLLEAKDYFGESIRNELFTIDDPARDVFGPAKTSHPQELDLIKKNLRQIGVEVEYREGVMSYQPHPIQGFPGKIVIEPDASYYAWKHEEKHAIDDYEAGWLGFRFFIDPQKAKALENAAYDMEIQMARDDGEWELAKKLEELKRKEIGDYYE